MPTDPIRHVVVLMLENHAFDQMLGAFRSLFPDLEGQVRQIEREGLDNDWPPL
jgi:phospholipase C